MSKEKPIKQLSLTLSEAEVKKGVEDYLTIQQNQGKLMFLRLQSGSLLVKYGDRFNKVNMCPIGTADYVVFQGEEYCLNHNGQRFQYCEPVLGCRVTFLEVKSSKGKQSDEQQVFEEEVKKMNCRYFIVRDADSLEDMLK